jgi:hypothetical protein
MGPAALDPTISEDASRISSQYRFFIFPDRGLSHL